MANASIDSVRNTMSKAKELLNNVSTSNPTLTPLMDLSNINSGLSQVETMFNRSRSLALASSINVQSNSQMIRETVDSAVNAVLNKINQNGEDIGNQTYVLETHVDMNGREIAKASAKYTQEELNRLNKIESRKRGNI